MAQNSQSVTKSDDVSKPTSVSFYNSSLKRCFLIIQHKRAATQIWFLFFPLSKHEASFVLIRTHITTTGRHRNQKHLLGKLATRPLITLTTCFYYPILCFIFAPLYVCGLLICDLPSAGQFGRGGELPGSPVGASGGDDP